MTEAYPKIGNDQQTDPYAWAKEWALAESAGEDIDESWMGFADDSKAERLFTSTSVRLSFYTDEDAVARATEMLGGAGRLAEVERELAALPETAEQRALIARMSPRHMAAFMEIAARKLRGMFEEEER